MLNGALDRFWGRWKSMMNFVSSRCLMAVRRFGRGFGFLLPVAALVLAIAPGKIGLAQTAAGVTADQLLQLQQQYQQRGVEAGPNTGNQALQPDIVLQPAVPALAGAAMAPSRLEQIMSARAGAKLEQFGYDQLGQGRAVTVPQTGAVQDDYVLGPGDEIVASLHGAEVSGSPFTVTVDRNGQVILPRLSPIPATGRTLGSFRQDVQAAVKRAYVATDATVSVGRVRQISVLVSGEVNNPGQELLTGLNSAVDALLIAGGVKKTGSLRNIRIQRSGRIYDIDLYSVLTGGGGGSSFRLADGDRIVVPPLGPTLAVTGLVRRPGIYELPAHQSGLSTRMLLQLAGGQEVRGQYRLSVLRMLPDGRSGMEALSSETALLHDSEILFVQLGADQTTSQATLSGGTGLSGLYPITPGTRLSDIIKAPGALGDAPYTLFGLVSRRDPVTLLRTLVAFTPVAVLNGTEDQPLQSGDVVRPLSVTEIRLLNSTVYAYSRKQDQERTAQRNPLAQPANAQAQDPANAAYQQEADIRAVGNMTQATLDNAGNGAPDTNLNTVATAAKVANGVAQQAGNSQPGTPANNGAVGQIPAASNGQQSSYAPAPNFEDQEGQPGTFPANREVPTFNILAQQLGVDPLVLVNFLLGHQITVDGAVRGPGNYFVGPNVALKYLVQSAGGTVNWADESAVELISTDVNSQNGTAVTQRLQSSLNQDQFASYIVKPHDEFRFNQVFNDTGIGSATVQGEIRFPGNYQITRGEHLSDLLARAGGLTNQAYPYGTVFLRKSAADQERDSYIRAAKDIEDELVIAMTRVGTDKISPDTFASMQTFVTDLRNQKAIGRISVTADPGLLASKPALDPLLESGDVIYIPQRPSTIAVLGQVMQPGSYPYESGLSLGDYIEKAGGYARTADDSDTYIVLPDGSARKVEKSWFSFDTTSLPPGSAIVVPRDVTPLDLRQTIIDVTQIFSQLAVSIASVAVISR